MKVLIVCATMSERSFNASMLDTATATLRAGGHEVRLSNLQAMNFDPVARPEDFVAPKDPAHVRYDLEQRHAVEQGAFSDDIAAELDKLLWCDCLILQFPLHWFSLPAIIKGWIDRVFVNGVVYGGGKWYDRGGLKGRRAMLAFSTGCYPSMCGPDGINGDMDIILWPIQNGTLRFAGMDVLPPFIAWSVAYKTDEERRGMLADYADHLKRIETMAPLDFHHRDDFTKEWRLKDGIAPRATGQMSGRPIRFS